VVGACGDYLIGYSEKFDEYGLWVHDGPGGSPSSPNVAPRVRPPGRTDTLQIAWHPESKGEYDAEVE
jgi:hypothetical protein